MATQAPLADSSTRQRNLVRLINIGLLGCLIVVAMVAVVLNWRRVQFRATGYVIADGATYYLHPDDNYLTQLIVQRGEYEPTQTQLIRDILKEGDVFLDVGANVGWYTIHGAQQVGRSGKVIAFEPEPSNLAMLKRNVEVNALSNVVAESVALSNAEGSFKLHLKKENLGMHSLVLGHEGGKHYINVKTVRLDDYWKGQGDIKLVKIDTEGAEGMILDGMRETLKRQIGIELIIEYAPDRLIQSGHDPDKVLGDLYQIGFKASIIDESVGQVIYLGTPQANAIPPSLNPAYPTTNLYLKR